MVPGELRILILLEVGRAVNILSVNVLNAVGDVTYPFITDSPRNTRK